MSTDRSRAEGAPPTASTSPDNQPKSTDRRRLLQALGGAVVVAPMMAGIAEASPAPQQTPPAPAADHGGGAIPNMMGSEEIAMLLYPGFTALDFVGPQFFFAGLMGAKVHLVTNQDTLDPVVSDTRLAITPTRRLSDMAGKIDVIFVPGGSQGTLAAMEHAPTLKFLRARAGDIRLKTSVCTGSLVLAAAGILKGRRATSHWVARDQLKLFGAVPTDERVVRDGDIITGAGVSAGLDMALSVVEALRGRTYAQALMLQAEYAPAPPFPGGRPETTDPAVAAVLRSMFAPLVTGIDAIAKRA